MVALNAVITAYPDPKKLQPKISRAERLETTTNKAQTKWPVLPGTYQVGDPSGPVAVCALTSEKLMGPLAAVPGVAIAGMVYTANLGITRIIINVTANPAIRFLLICGRDSALFKPGQSIVSLSEKGIDEKKRIIDALGYDPVLPTIDPDQVKQFRKQVEVIDWTGEEDLHVLSDRVKSLAGRNPGVFETGQVGSVTGKREEFETIRPGGQREPLIYDPRGYFVISIEPEAGEIVLRHYLPDHTPAHEMRGRGATSMLLGLLRDGLVTQLSHAGYLGEELAKAQTALQFGLRYDQDRSLRPRETAPPPPPEVKTAEPAAPKVEPTQAYSLKKFGDIGPGALIDLFFSVTDTPRDHILGGVFLDMDDSGAARVYTRTSQRLEVEWTGSSKLIMGGAADVVEGAILRVFGKLDEKKLVHAETLIILTNVAKITEPDPGRGN
jgi:tetrahydromethanopterin S-methyltransferase subunit A